MTQTPQHDITDVANWFLNMEPMPHKKLQKLSYYAVAWKYALQRKSLCRRDEFQAWIHGPVNMVLYNKYRHNGWDLIYLEGSAPKFDPIDTDFLETVWNTYGELSGHQLEALTHTEDPWIKARGALMPTEPSNNIISVDDMIEYYNKIYDEGQND